jgi:hypothetical protein
VRLALLVTLKFPDRRSRGDSHQSPLSSIEGEGIEIAGNYQSPERPAVDAGPTL